MTWDQLAAAGSFFLITGACVALGAVTALVAWLIRLLLGRV